MEVGQIALAFLTATIGGALWWRLGRLEERVNGVVEDWKSTKGEWSHLKRVCPLCIKRED